MQFPVQRCVHHAHLHCHVSAPSSGFDFHVSEMAEGGDGRPNRKSSAVHNLWTEPGNDTEDSGDGPNMGPRPHYYEELFCTGRASVPLVPLSGALMASSGPQSDVLKQGYLRKQERGHRRYFVLRAGSHTGPSRLEWYKSLEKFTSTEKSASKMTLFSSNKQGVIYLRCCLGVSRTGGSRKGHMVALYAKDQTMVLVMDDQQEQEDWYVAMKQLMEEEQREEEPLDEEDDGYCTLPSAAFFKEVWPVTVKSRGVGSSRFLAGENRLCLTPTSLIMVRVSAGDALPSVTIPLLSVRRFGHLDGLFYLELGRSAPNGPGEIWMEARDQGDRASAQHIHEAVRETLRALRALPDFSRSPSSNQPPVGLPSKRCRTRCRVKSGTWRTHGSLAQLPRKLDIGTSPIRQPPRQNPDPTGGQIASSTSSSRYLEMKVYAGSLQENWGMTEEEEEEEEGPGYMTMSPRAGHSPSGSSLEDYVSMASPHRHQQLTSSPSSDPSPCALQTSLDSSTSDISSPLHQLHPISFSAPPLQLFTDLGPVSAPTATADSSPTPSTAQSGSDPSVRGCWLTMCFPTCLQAKTGS